MGSVGGGAPTVFLDLLGCRLRDRPHRYVAEPVQSVDRHLCRRALWGGGAVVYFDRRPRRRGNDRRGARQDASGLYPRLPVRVAVLGRSLPRPQLAADGLRRSGEAERSSGVTLGRQFSLVTPSRNVLPNLANATRRDRQASAVTPAQASSVQGPPGRAHRR